MWVLKVKLFMNSWIEDSCLSLVVTLVYAKIEKRNYYGNSQNSLPKLVKVISSYEVSYMHLRYKIFYLKISLRSFYPIIIKEKYQTLATGFTFWDVKKNVYTESPIMISYEDLISSLIKKDWLIPRFIHKNMRNSKCNIRI